MKSLLKMTLLGSAIIFALTGCDEKKAETNSVQPTSKEVSTTVNPDKQYDQKDEAYAVGVSMGSYLKENLERSDVVLDADYIGNGFRDALSDKAKYNREEIETILKGLDRRLEKEAEARISANREAGEKYREEFATQSGVKKTDSGLLYQIIDEGKGEHPTADDTVIVHYVGTLIDGKKFDSSYDRGETAQFPLSKVIKGWKEGIQLIGVGGKIKLVVPPELAYGDQASPNIPAASTLVFEVELLGINDQNDQDNTANENETETAQ